MVRNTVHRGPSITAFMGIFFPDVLVPGTQWRFINSCVVIFPPQEPISEMGHPVSNVQSRSRYPLPLLSEYEPQPQSVVAPDFTSGVYVQATAHVIPYWESGRILGVHSLVMRLCILHSFRRKHHRYHVVFPSISPFFISKSLPKTIIAPITIILNHLNPNKWSSFACVNHFTSSRSAPPVRHWRQTVAPPVSFVFSAALGRYGVSCKG